MSRNILKFAIVVAVAVPSVAAGSSAAFAITPGTGCGTATSFIASTTTVSATLYQEFQNPCYARAAAICAYNGLPNSRQEYSYWAGLNEATVFDCQAYWGDGWTVSSGGHQVGN
jgi:hypothetical protein